MAARTVGVLGGSFNPPHLSHQFLCLTALQAHGLDEVWAVPTFSHPFGKSLASYEHRVEMCKLAFEVFGGAVSISTVERELAGDGPSYTLRTLERLQVQNPDVSLRLVIGSDILRETDKWHRWERVVALAPPLVIQRREANDAQVALGVLYLPQISSSHIRNQIAAGESVAGLVPASIIDYIERHGLYRSH